MEEQVNKSIEVEFEVEQALQRAMQYEDYINRLEQAYPLLTKKARTRWICKTANLTDDEQKERKQVIKALIECKILFIACGIEVRLFNKEDSENHLKTLKEILCVGLYLLSRCGDEGAFLELSSLDPDFWQHGFFHRSLLNWRIAAHESDERTITILKKLAEILQFPNPPRTKPKEYEKDAFVNVQYRKYKSNHPQWFKNTIYKQIAKDWETEYNETITPSGIRKRLKRSEWWPFNYLEQKPFEYLEQKPFPPFYIQIQPWGITIPSKIGLTQNEVDTSAEKQ